MTRLLTYTPAENTNRKPGRGASSQSSIAGRRHGTHNYPKKRAKRRIDYAKKILNDPTIFLA